jgi:hypothetical protein
MKGTRKKFDAKFKTLNELAMKWSFAGYDQMSGEIVL